MNSFTLPIFLSGPMVRRADSTEITIWIATSKSYRILGKIFGITSIKDSKSFEYRLIHTKTETHTIRMGKQLFIHLLKLTPYKGTFPTDTLLGYNLHFKRGSEIHDLQTLGFLSKDSPGSIVYGNLDYPSFYLNSSSQNSNILYGSCRKPHGEDDDTLASADLLIEKEYTNLQIRPNTLFLLGDQLYADDVANPLFPVISRLSKELMGTGEQLELIDDRLKNEPFHTALNQINGRKYIMENFCQFTSSHSNNHLMKFGEYAAMYLLVWNPDLWKVAQDRALFESFEELVKNQQVHFVFPDEARNSKEHKKERVTLKNEFTIQQEALISFQHFLYRVRRLLANIPTYMMFDDHDITDDWNISYNWKKNVSTSPLGSHVVANGLAAFWAFQGWGNSPETYDERFLWMMKS
ncbi:hypothetical protein [Neobacillus vireti]|uniref:hypothetical protein n=1 Tax=Neobacillus vireti TaxID=220686 RepID=UPI003000665F